MAQIAGVHTIVRVASSVIVMSVCLSVCAYLENRQTHALLTEEDRATAIINL